MVETIGKQLCKARLGKGLTIDEAAHATKMRPDKILALENDDYSRFGNNTYAKGFIQIYGRFLDVNVSGHIVELETPRYVSVDDYQYLNNAPEPKFKQSSGPRRRSGPPSIVPLLVFFGLFAVAGFGFMVFVNYQRIAPAGAGGAARKNPGDDTAASKPDPFPTSNPAERGLSLPEKRETDPPAPASQPVRTTAPTSGRAVATTVEGIEIRRAEPITPGGVNEIVLEPIKKTWVTIRKGNPDSKPIFEDYLYPGPPLKLRGSKFYLEVRDQTAVQIRKNGNPIAYQAPGISIQ